MEFLKVFFNLDLPKNGFICGYCKLCNGSYKDKVRSTGNFHKHLRRRHAKEYAEHRELESGASDVETNVSLEYAGGSHDDKVNQSIVSNLIVRCNLPLSIVEHVGFRKFMSDVARKRRPASARYLKLELFLFCMHQLEKRSARCLTKLIICLLLWTFGAIEEEKLFLESRVISLMWISNHRPFCLGLSD